MFNIINVFIFFLNIKILLELKKYNRELKEFFRENTKIKKEIEDRKNLIKYLREDELKNLAIRKICQEVYKNEINNS